MTKLRVRSIVVSFALALTAMACGGSDADALNIGAECVNSEDCDNREDFDQTCLNQFKGGYCGISGCSEDVDCPTDSACVAHTDSVNYCFRTCLDKSECNANRTEDNEANCSSNVVFTENTDGLKACVPPSN